MILSEQLSKKIVNIMSDNNIIDSHLDAAYIYCIDFALDLVLFNLSIIIIGALTHNFILSVIYVTVLVPTKMLAGGAHAGSTYACCSISYSNLFSEVSIINLDSVQHCHIRILHI